MSFIVGENDPLCPVDLLRQMESQLKGSQVCIYTGAENTRFAQRKRLTQGSLLFPNHEELVKKEVVE